MFEGIDKTSKKLIFLRLVIAENLKFLRKKHSITQVELAEMTGINKVTIAKYESCKMSISLEKLLVICKALDESPNTILKGWEEIL